MRSRFVCAFHVFKLFIVFISSGSKFTTRLDHIAFLNITKPTAEISSTCNANISVKQNV